MPSWVDRVSAVRAVIPRLPLAGEPGPLVVTYHAIGEGSDEVSVDRLARQLEALTERRRVVPLAEAIRSLGTPRSQELASVTFDDGYRNFQDLAVPILSKLGIPTTLFFPAGHIGGTNAWDNGRAPERRLLASEQLASLDPALVEIGCHGYEHRRLAGLSDRDLDLETREARRILENIVGRRVRLFAYPYGQLTDFDARSEQTVAATGFEAACSTHFGRGSRPQDRFRLRRVGISPDDTLDVAERKFDGAYDWTAWKERTAARLRRLGLRT